MKSRKFLFRTLILFCIVTLLGENLSLANSSRPGGCPSASSSTTADPRPGRPCPTPSDGCATDPVLLTGGKFFLPVIDVDLPGFGRQTGTNLRFQRSYSSQDGFEGITGAGWVSILDTRVIYSGGSTLTVRDQFGTLLDFIQQSTNLFTDGQYKVEKQADGSFIYTLPLGNTYKFNSQGKPLSVKNPAGITLSFNYTGNAITSLSDGSGRTLLFAYNAAGKLDQLKDPLGRVWHYEYDAKANLISVTDPLNRKTSYAYTDALDPHNITSVTDSMGFVTKYEYTDKDQVKKEIKPDGSEIRFIFDNLLGASSMIDEFGKIWSFEYVRIGLTTTVVDPDGGVWRYQYDTNTNLMTSKKDPLGHTTSYTYNAAQDTTVITDALGNKTQYTYDSNHHWLSRKDAKGNTTTRVFDPSGNLIKITDALGHTTSFSYDAIGQEISQTDVLGNVITFGYDAYGNLILIKDALGNSTQYAYDLAGRKTSQTDALGHITKFSYDNGNRLLRVDYADSSSITQTYDNNDRVLTQTDANANATTFSYESPLSTGGTGCSSCSASSGGQGAAKPVSITDPMGNITRLTYDAHGKTTSITDAKGNVTRAIYGIFDRLIQTQDALGNATSYSYDLKGSLLSVADANDHKTSFQYDELDRTVSQKDALANETKYSYDSIGNLVQRIDANGKITIYKYDALDRRTVTQYPDNTSVSSELDSLGNILSMSGSTGTTKYAYDKLNRLIKVTFSKGKTITYAFDAAGNRKSVISEGDAIQYSYDALNRPVEVASEEGITSYSYDRAGRRIQALYPNGIKAAYTYDKNNRLLALTHTVSNPKTLLPKSSYTYDVLGNRLSLKDNEGAHTYTYDSLNRLVSVVYPSGVKTQYVYDKVGNRLSLKQDTATTLYTYDAANRLLSAGTQSLAYDANGNTILLKDSSTTLTTNYDYDFENRLKKVTQTLKKMQNTSFYSYDGLGRRMQTDIDGDITNFYYDAFDILFETNAKEKIKRSYVDGPRVDEVISVEKGDKTHFYLYDGLGSVTALTNLKGNLQNTYNYDVFGALRLKTGDFENRYLFTGRELDSDTNIYYYRNRYYNPTEGRFLTKDPIGLKGGINQYVYVNDNPIKFVDPFGFQGIVPGPIISPEPPRTGNPTPLDCPDKACPPCPAPPSKETRIDKVPPGRQHWPCPGDHLHTITYEYNQNPNTCECFLKSTEEVTCL